GHRTKMKLHGGPPDGNFVAQGRGSSMAEALKQKPRCGKPRRGYARRFIVSRRAVLCRPGSDLLFQALRLSTIGAVEFNGRVRDGNGFRLHARTTRPAKDGQASWFSLISASISRSRVLHAAGEWALEM